MFLPLFYGLLAALAMWATWHDEDLRWIGLWLVFGWLLSNLLFFSVPVIHRPGPYTFIEMMVALSAYCAWGVHAGRRYSKALVAIVVTNLVSIGFNIGFASSFPPVYRQIHLFEIGTNICFGIECVLAFGSGIADGYRIGRFYRWPHFRSSIAQRNARKEHGP